MTPMNFFGWLKREILSPKKYWHLLFFNAQFKQINPRNVNRDLYKENLKLLATNVNREGAQA